MRHRISCFCLALLLTLTGCAMTPADPDTAQESIQVIAMDTAMLITTYGEHSVTASYAAEDRIRELEQEGEEEDEDEGWSEDGLSARRLEDRELIGMFRGLLERDG